MVRNVAALLPELDAEDFYLLSGVEHGMRFSEWVSRGKLPGFADLSPEEVDYRLDRCEDRGLVERKTIQYEGFKLTFEGYDVLALRTFAERDTVTEFGSPLGVGKESDVYEVRGEASGGDGDAPALALKFHREGYTNFREVHKERDYAHDKEHVSWMYTARKAAEREFEVLSALAPSVRVPEPLDQNRHALVMEQMPGVELARAALGDGQAVGVLDLVLRELAAAYEAGYVHADVSEYNVFVAESGVTVFDWPQAVSTDHDNARELLERDVANAVGYVRRKYPAALGEVDVPAVAAAVAAGEFESVENHRPD